MSRVCLLFSVFVVVAVVIGCGGGSDPSERSDSRVGGLGSPLGAGTVKVTVCHMPPGNPENEHTIVVGEPAVRAHLAHGDTLGACGADAGEPDAGEPDGGITVP